MSWTYMFLYMYQMSWLELKTFKNLKICSLLKSILQTIFSKTTKPAFFNHAAYFTITNICVRNHILKIPDHIWYYSNLRNSNMNLIILWLYRKEKINSSLEKIVPSCPMSSLCLALSSPKPIIICCVGVCNLKTNRYISLSPNSSKMHKCQNKNVMGAREGNHREINDL